MKCIRKILAISAVSKVYNLLLYRGYLPVDNSFNKLVMLQRPSISNTTNTPLHMAQRVTLFGKVINTTNTNLHMAQRVTLAGEVINTTNTPLHISQRVTLLKKRS